MFQDRHPKVLVVDDLPDCRDSLISLLRLWGWTDFVEAGTLADAVEKAADVDVCLLDLGLPDCSNPGETFELFQSRTASHPIPVIVITGHDDLELGQEVIKSGAQDFFCKTDVDSKWLSKSILFSCERFRRRRLEVATREADRLASMVLEDIAKLRQILTLAVTKPDGHMTEAKRAS